MSDDDDGVSPYGTHQHASPAAVRTHTLVGEPARLETVDAAVVGASRAMFSTAPYVPPKAATAPVIPPPPKPTPKPKPKPEPKPEPQSQTGVGPRGCHGKHGTCGAPAETGEDYCVFHLNFRGGRT